MDFHELDSNDYKLQSTVIQAFEKQKRLLDISSFVVRSRRKERRVQYVRGQSIIHRIGTKCLFTSSFELSKLGTISDLRLGSREVPRVRSVIYVSPSPKRDPPPTTIQATFNPFCRPSTHPSILITTSDSLVDWIGDLFVHPVCLFDLQTPRNPIAYIRSKQ